MFSFSQKNRAVDEVSYNIKDHSMWERLFNKQVHNLQDKAHETFLRNLNKMNLPSTHIPQLEEISKKIKESTGWGIFPVSGLIGYELYFKLLSQRKFPCATFIRSENEENLSKDPDIFHEIFGHCTMLLSDEYANFMCEYGKFALTVKKEDRPLFSRLIWFTTETGLLQSSSGLKIFGSSILSSYLESIYCLESNEPIIKPFNIINIFQEPYRADLLQKVYYVLSDSNQLFNILDDIPGLYKALAIAKRRGESAILFPVEHNKYSNIGHCMLKSKLI